MTKSSPRKRSALPPLEEILPNSVLKYSGGLVPMILQAKARDHAAPASHGTPFAICDSAVFSKAAQTIAVPPLTADICDM
jgi:hypothetical protein